MTPKIFMKFEWRQSQRRRHVLVGKVKIGSFKKQKLKKNLDHPGLYCILCNYQKSVPVTHQHATFWSEMRTQETIRNLELQVPITARSFEAEISVDILSANLTCLCNNVSVVVS